jgi:nucleoside-diphosphate-sugar epimerase
MGRRAVVTGATGFIGWNAAERLRDSGWDVRGTVRPERRRPLPDGVEPVAVSLMGPGLADAFRGADVIVHLAGLTAAPRPRHFHRGNVVMTDAVARAAREVDARLIHVSSQAAAGPAPPEAPRHEADASEPITPYGVSKLAGERAVRAIPELRWTILRPTSVYGPRDRGFFTVFRLARRGFFLTTGTAEIAYTLVHVHDVARAIDIAAQPETPSHDVFFIGHRQHRSEQDIWRTLARVFDRPYRPIGVPRPVLWAWALAGDLSGYLGFAAAMTRSRLRELGAGGFVCNVDKARDELGFEAAIDLDAGFETTAEWYSDHGWL